MLFGVRQRLETLMQLGRRLEEQEQAAAQEDQIPERERMPPYGKDRIREGHEPRHDGKKAETHRERKPEAHVKGLVLLGRRELFGDDGDEDEIVDPENDFKNDEREKTDPDGRIKQKFHVLLRDEASDPRMPGARPKAFPIEKRTKTDASDKITIFSSAVGAFASSFHGSATSRKLFMPLSERLSSRVAAEALVLPGPEPRGVPAVIDKDFGSELLAELLDADVLVILTAVEQVAINFNKPDQKGLDDLTPAQAKVYMDENQFAKGSMLPKVQAAVKFAESKAGRTALITLLEKAKDGIEGKTGTRVHQ